MRLYSNVPCAVVLTESNTEVLIEDYAPLTVPANHLTLINPRNNVDFSALNKKLVAHVSSPILNDYLQFLHKDLTNITPWPRRIPPVISCKIRTPDVFRQAALQSTMQPETISETERTRSLLFTVLSCFLEHPGFISLLMLMLRSSVKESVCCIIESCIQKEWSLNQVASTLYLSPSLLKKRLKSENTSYSQIITECRMRYAARQLAMTDKNIAQIAEMCGYSSTSYFISVFKSCYGITPLRYVTQKRYQLLRA